MSAWRALGMMTGMVTAFVGVFAMAFEITGGSIWMLAFIPLMFGATGAIAALTFHQTERTDQ